LLKKIFGESKAEEQKPKTENRKPRPQRSRRPRSNNRPQGTTAEWSIDDFKVEPVEGKTRFHDLGLHKDLMHGIADTGFEYCSPIQAASLP